jgi:putative hydrolase of the HAD superfamily
MASEPENRLRALVVDYGGVLTNPFGDALSGGLSDAGIDPATFGALIREWTASDAAASPVHALERGDIAIEDLERELAGRLTSTDGRKVDTTGLVRRLLAGFEVMAEGMVGVVQRARAHGLLTGLLSNSWGLGYDRSGWDELFDAVVISGEVRMRKPEPRIYRLVASRLGVRPSECVFVDDIGLNVRGAVAVGMVGIHHADTETTAAELEALLGVSLT